MIRSQFECKQGKIVLLSINLGMDLIIQNVRRQQTEVKIHHITLLSKCKITKTRVKIIELIQLKKYTIRRICNELNLKLCTVYSTIAKYKKTGMIYKPRKPTNLESQPAEESVIKIKAEDKEAKDHEQYDNTQVQHVELKPKKKESQYFIYKMDGTIVPMESDRNI